MKVKTYLNKSTH